MVVGAISCREIMPRIKMPKKSQGELRVLPCYGTITRTRTMQMRAPAEQEKNQASSHMSKTTTVKRPKRE